MPDEKFQHSMPEAYRRVFDTSASFDHADIVAHRRQKPVHVERWRTLPGDVTVLCVVAVDRAGLLSLISAAFAKCGLVIRSAQIYTREASPEPEAVDFFWVTRDVDAVGLISDDLLVEIEAQITNALAPPR